MTLSFSFSGWVTGAEVERVYVLEQHREFVVDSGQDKDKVRLLDPKTKEVIYNITVEEFKDGLQDGRFSLSLIEMLDADCHKSEREIFDIDDVEV